MKTDRHPIWNNTRVMVCSVNSEDYDLSPAALALASFIVEASDLVADGRIYIERGTSMPLDFERSRMAAVAADPDNNFTHVYMHDTDMPLCLAHLEKLLTRERDVVSGTYFMAGWQPQPDGTSRPFPCVAQYDGKYITRTRIAEAAERDELIEVHGTGAGALLVTTAALRAIGSPAFQFQWNVMPRGAVKEGEDYYFCRMARAAKYTVWMDPTVQVDHFKLMRVGLSLRDMNGKHVTTFTE